MNCPFCGTVMLPAKDLPEGWLKCSSDNCHATHYPKKVKKK